MMTINARASGRTPREYTLRLDHRVVGVLRPGSLVIGTFATVQAAREAAGAGAAILARWCEERGCTLATIAGDVPADRLVEAGDTRVGRLQMPGDDPAVEGHSFELRLPDQLWVATGLGLAQRICAVLEQEPASV